MLGSKRAHHTVVTATDYARSKVFYCDILGFTLQNEFYHAECDFWKGDLALNGEYMIKLFSFPFPPVRPSRPEACGLYHLVFSVDDIDVVAAHLTVHGVECEVIRIDPFTGKRSTFFGDPDDLSLEIYQQ